MADVNRTIDRSIRICRSVADVLPAAPAHRRRALRQPRPQAPGARSRRPARPRRRRSNLRANGASTRSTPRSGRCCTGTRCAERGNQWLEHEAAGKPPVLDYRYEVIADARSYERPANYALVRIIPPRGVEVDDTKRPFVIVDPRAGHGPGIGGFKEDSEVGVALRAGHAVYFVIFYPEPMPRQTLADITDAEAEFIRIVAERHPQSEKPVVIGNCQGGWAVMMLAAARPDIAGPLVINGAPMSYWSGNDGESPMRYAGGLLGGTWLSLLAADLGAGTFDGAHLVQNFENLHPANTLWEKWYHLYANIDTEVERFLEFERWWGGFYLFNEEEIRWIVNNLFVGNKLSSGEARLGPGPLLRPQVDQAADHRLRVDGRQHHAAAAGVQLDRRRLQLDGGDQGERPDDRRPAARGRRPPRHLRVRQGGEEGARADRRGAEVHPGPAAGLVRHEHRRVRRRRRRGQVRRHAGRAQGRGPAHPAEVRPRRREAVPGGGRASPSSSSARIRCSCGRSCATRCPSGSPRRCATSIRCACSTGRSRTRTRCCGRCRPYAAMVRSQRAPRTEDNDNVALEKLASRVHLPRSRSLPRRARCDVRGLVLPRLRQHDVAADGRRAGGDAQQAQVRPALDPGGARSARHARGRERRRGPRAHRDAHQQGGPRRAIACRRCRRRASSCRPRARSRTCPRTLRRRLLQEETIVVEFEPERAKRSLPKLLRTAADRRRAHALLEWTEQQPGLEDRQRRLASELRAMLPVQAARTNGARRRKARVGRLQPLRGAGQAAALLDIPSTG